MEFEIEYSEANQQFCLVVAGDTKTNLDGSYRQSILSKTKSGEIIKLTRGAFRKNKKVAHFHGEDTI